jgi:hypothetical protein
MMDRSEFLTGQRLSRRTLLRGAGAVMALPLLEAMMPLTARAQSGGAKGAPKRLAFMFVPNGIHMKAWTPGAEGPLTALPNTLEPLAGMKDSLLVLTGLTQDGAHAHGDGGGDHARSAAAWLTGCHPRKTHGADIKAGISADQIAARYMGNLTRFPSLELGCERGGLAGDCDSGYSCAYSSTISWRGEATPNAKEVSPRDVFDRLFGTGDESGENLTPAQRAERQAANRSVLDAVMEEAGVLRRGLGMHDRQKLDEYFTSVREIERRVEWAEKAARQPANPQAALLKNGIPSGIPTDYAEHIRLMGDMMVLAFQADLTRVTTFMFANEGSNRSYGQIGIAEGHHELSHHGGSAEKQTKVQQINRFHTEQLTYVLNKMKSIKEADGTLLDNTLVVYGGGISDGDRHNHDDLPILVAGGKGIVRAGRHIKYPNGTPMTNLFMTAFDRMGMPTEKIGSIGDSNGKLAQLF